MAQSAEMHGEIQRSAPESYGIRKLIPEYFADDQRPRDVGGEEGTLSL